MEKKKFWLLDDENSYPQKKRCGIMRIVIIFFKCFKLSWKAWLKSDYFKRCRLYVIAAAGCAMLTSIMNFTWFHNWILGILFLLLSLFNLIYNWFMWFRFVLNEQYGGKTEWKKLKN